MSSTRRVRWIAMSMASLVLVAGCDADAEDPEPSGGADPQEISVMVSGDPEELEAYRLVAQGFEASRSGVTVNLIEIADRDEMIARLGTSIAGGDAPDLFLLNYRYYGQFQAKGALEPLNAYLQSSEAFSAEEFYPEAMVAFQEDGEQTCMPQNVSSLVVYYNEKLFKQAGVAYPEPNWSWISMVQAAMKLTKDTDGDGAIDQYGLGVDPEIIRAAPFIWSNKGTLTNDEADPTRYTLTTPEATQAIQAFLDLRSRAGVTPTDEEAESADFESRFLDGSLGMIMESRKVVPAFRTIEDFGWNVAALPVHQVPATVLHSDAYCMTADADDKDAAWAYLEYALGTEGQQIAVGTGRTVPSMRAVAESDVFLDPTASPADSQVFLDNIPLLHAVPHIATWPQIEDVTNGLFEEAYYEPGGGEAPELVVAITQQTKDLFADADGG
ncbi:MAG: sugar ABC transporter substrate-binding protein [Actinomycetota bacterium]